MKTKLVSFFFLTFCMSIMLNAQKSCDSGNINDMLLMRRIEIDLKDLSRSFIRRWCPNTGREADARTLDCRIVTGANGYTTASGKTFYNPLLLDVVLSFNGWTCYSVDSDSYWEVAMIVIVSDEEIVDIPEEYIELSDAFDKAAFCENLLGPIVNDLIENWIEANKQ